MPTKKELQEMLMERMSEYAHMERNYKNKVSALEQDVYKLECDLAKAKAYLRPFFIARDATSGVILERGMVQCPVCDASAPGTLKVTLESKRAVVTTVRPLEHRDGCFFQVQREHTVPAPCTLTGPDGERLQVDLSDIVHMEDRITYTTVIVSDKELTKRLVVCETPATIRQLRRNATGEEHAKPE